VNLRDIARRFSGGLLDGRLPELPKSDREKVFENPEGYTRASRRSVGYLKPVWAKAMRPHGLVIPRYARRHLTAAMIVGSHSRKVRKQRARVLRAFARAGRNLV
jgi:hypothetical protein